MKKLCVLKKIFILLCVFCAPAAALDPQGPLSLAMGGSGRAVTQKGAEYHLLNPANLIHSQNFHGEGFYVFGQDKRKPYWGVSLTENRQVPLALSYIRERESEEQYLSISTAGFILPGWSLGLSLSRWQQMEKEDAYWNIQSGILIKPKQSSFSIGATWDHILPIKGPYTGKRRWGLGLGYQVYKWLYLRADGLYSEEKKWLFCGGGETLISGFLILRLGGRWYLTQKKFLFSGGIGLTAKQLAVDYSISQNEDTKQWLHAITARGSF